ncbi:MAG: hypothetical protein WCI87_06880 [Euryarchaeota archaeon]
MAPSATGATDFLTLNSRELDMLGLLSAKKFNKGRKRRTNLVASNMFASLLGSIVRERHHP